MTGNQEQHIDNETTDDMLEIDAMRMIIQAFSRLNDAAKSRVLQWAIDKYDTNRASEALQKRGADRFQVSRDVTGQTASSGLDFPDLPSLFAAANPATASEKALVVGYWFQVKQGQTDLDSFQLHKELKNLGHPVANITRALEDLKAAQPQLVIQTRKTGTTRQARKKYRLSLEGINRVNQMVIETKRTAQS